MSVVVTPLVMVLSFALTYYLIKNKGDIKYFGHYINTIAFRELILKTIKLTNRYAIYGYKKSPEDKNQWIIDEEAAEIVKRIFNLCIEGYGVSQIAKILMNEKVERPSYYMAKRGQGTRQTSLIFYTNFHISLADSAIILYNKHRCGKTCLCVKTTERHKLSRSYRKGNRAFMNTVRINYSIQLN